MHTCKSSLGPFFPTQKIGKNRISHRAWTKVSKRALPTITKSRQFHAQASPWKKRNSPLSAFCGNDEILLCLLVFSWKQLCIALEFLLNFLRDDPGWAYWAHHFPSFSLSAQSPRPASRKMSSTVKKKLKICPITWVKKNFPWLSMFKPFSKVIQLLKICQFISSRPMLFTFPPQPRSPLDWGLEKTKITVHLKQTKRKRTSFVWAPNLTAVHFCGSCGSWPGFRT